ncbi:MAG TPA: cupin domain-containing protein [Terracidiphilus sp.]|jgi:quercetin dioxygenase-like cupin family protein
MSVQTIERTQLMKVVTGLGRVSAVDVREIHFAPGQETGRHMHPCAVVGYIVAGTAGYQIEGQPAQLLPTGSAFHEPAGKVISSFRNRSKTEPMTFVAFYLLDGAQELITMLDND